MNVEHLQEEPQQQPQDQQRIAMERRILELEQMIATKIKLRVGNFAAESPDPCNSISCGAIYSHKIHKSNRMRPKTKTAN